MEQSPLKNATQAVSEGLPHEALQILMDSLTPKDKYYDEVIVLQGRIKRLDKQIKSGVISREEESLEHNRLNEAILELIRLLENHPDDTTTPTSLEDIQSWLDSGQLDQAARGIFDVSQNHPDEKVRVFARELRDDLQSLRLRQNSKKGIARGEVEEREKEFIDRAHFILDQMSEVETPENMETPPPSPEETEQTENQDTVPSSLLDLRTRMENDQWAKEDLLGYEIYAEVIANMIIDEASSPPLAIGIIAPWGHGKTTLMQYVRQRLEAGLQSKVTEPESSAMSELKAYSDGRMADYRHVNQWLKELDKKEDGQKKEPFPVDAEAWPTVWFNPWQYQSSEQIWAGMAHALINQLVARLSPLNQEKFYFQLHMRRVDRNAIRQDIYRTALLSLIPNLAIVLLAFTLYVILALQPLYFSQWLVAGIPGGVALISLINGGRKWWTGTRKNLADKYDKYFKQPTYEDKLGMYHEVQADLQRVFDLLVDPKRPIVLFIDDLDRCSPKRVAEVIEAINLLMNGSYRDKCYFVLGMDAQIVAAALDVAYKDMYGRLDNRAKTAGSIGWYFLDKFIQLPFFIPTLDEEEKTLYLQRLFGEVVPDEAPASDAGQPDEAAMKRLVKEQVERAKRGESSERPKQSKTIQTQMDRLFIEVSLEESRDSSEILDQLKIYAPYLEDSPRGLKRFANLLRFYTAIQQLRIRDGEPSASTSALAKWLTVSLRWPQFVRWLQWSKEEHQLTIQTGKKDPTTIRNTVHGLAPREKAKRLDILIEQLPEVPDRDEEMEKIFQEQWLEQMKNFPQVPWLSDVELFEILLRKRSHESRLERAILVDIW